MGKAFVARLARQGVSRPPFRDASELPRWDSDGTGATSNALAATRCPLTGLQDPRGPKMKLARLMAAALLLAPIAFVGMTEPAAAANTHIVLLKGKMWVLDSGGLLGKSSLRKVPIDRQANLTHDAPKKTFKFKTCAGHETRGELSVALTLTSSDRVVTSTRLRLFEESGCDNDDLDGWHAPAIRVIGVGDGHRTRITVLNDEFESPDQVDADFTVRHNALPPNAPSQVVASRVPGDSHTISVEWTDEATDETGYEVRNTTTNQTKNLPPNTTRTTWPNPVVHRSCFQVRAVGVGGPSEWTPVGTQVECT